MDFSQLKISIKTWYRDSHELFDYEAEHIEHNIIVQNSGTLWRRGENVFFKTYSEQRPSDNSEYLLSIKDKNSGVFQICPAERFIDSVYPPKKLWTIIKNLPDAKYDLQINDIIKLGRIKFRVKQIAGDNDELNTEASEVPLHKISDEDFSLTSQCRICLIEGGSVEDPLIYPCNCKGTIKYVHVECLSHWINGRMDFSNSDHFCIKNIPCELCKKHFPTTIRLLDGRKCDLIRAPKPQAPFIVLEKITNANIGAHDIHVINMTKKTVFKLGRGNDADLKINDVSVSRVHATLSYKNGTFQLEDNFSKFGTLVSIREIKLLNQNESLVIQVGRSVLQFNNNFTKFQINNNSNINSPAWSLKLFHSGAEEEE